VSLIPSATEWVYALGLAGELVGVTFECDHPVDARAGRAVVVGGLDTSGLTPGEIDALVRATVASGQALYTIDAQAMARLAPDVVLTQDLCRVCALPADAAREAVQRAGCPGTVVTLDPHTLAEVLDGVLEVGLACGRAGEAAQVRARLQSRLDDVTRAVTGLPRPRVLVLEWLDPPFVAGHWVPDLVTAAGGDPVMAVAGGRSVTTTWDQVHAHLDQGAVDAVLVAPCGYDLPDAVEQAGEVAVRLARPVWAIAAGQVVTRPGPRVVDGVEALAAALHGWQTRPDLVALVEPS
jgi:iron complex transport system substrate-binding protein